MNCNYKVKITDIQNRYQFKILCKGGANSINVNDIYNLLPTTSTEGDAFSIANTSDIKAKSISIKGNTTQHTTTGKNIFPRITFSQTINGVTITATGDGTITIKGTANSSGVNHPIWGAWGSSTTLFTIPAGTYTASGIGTRQASPRMNIVTNGTTSIFVTNTTQTLDSDTNVTGIFIWVGAGTTVDTTFKPMIETGSTATSYEEYTGGIASPNPSYPQDVVNVTGTNTIKVENANKLPSAGLGTYTSSQMTHTCDGKGIYTFNGTANAVSSHYWEIEPYTIKSGDYLYLGNYVAQSGVSFSLWENNNTEIFSLGTSTFVNRIASLDSYAGKTITLVRTYSLAQSLTNFAIKPMICNVNTLTSYIAHQEKNYTINLGSIELCKISTYQDYIYKNNGNWYVHKEIGKYTITGSSDEAWALNSSGTYYKYQWSAALPDKYNVVDTPLYCDHFKQITVAQGNNRNVIGIANGYYNVYSLQIVCDISTLADFTTWLAENTPVVYYPLATATDTEITDTTLIKQLNNISNNIRTFEGGTNISSTSAGANPIINITTFNKLS